MLSARLPAATPSYMVASSTRDHIRGADRADALQTTPSAVRVGAHARNRAGERGSVAGRRQRHRVEQLWTAPPTRAGGDGQARRPSPRPLPARTSRPSATARARPTRPRAGRASSASSTRRRRSARRRRLPARASAARSGPSPATTSAMPASRQAAIATSTPFSGREPRDDKRVWPSRGPCRLRLRQLGPAARAPRATAPARAAAGHGRAPTAAARPSARKRSRANSARHDQRVGLRDQAVLPQRTARAIGERPRAALPRQFAGAHRAACRARGSGCTPRPRVKHTPIGADEAVLVQVQHDARPGSARGGEGAPSEASGWRLWACTTRAPLSRTGAGDVAGLQSPAQQPGRRSTAPERGRVSLQQLGGLVQVLAHEPLQILDGALLAAGGAVAGCAGIGPSPDQTMVRQERSCGLRRPFRGTSRHPRCSTCHQHACARVRRLALTARPPQFHNLFLDEP